MNDSPHHDGGHRGRKARPRGKHGRKLATALLRPEVMAEAPPPRGSERIARAIARAGLASRREAEAWIAAGRVAVNGAVIRSPALNVAASDRIDVDGQPLPQRERTRLFLFHKPRGLVTTSADPQGRATIFGALPKDLPRLMSVGRLDLNTEGLLLLTNDGGLARALELPSTGWLRRYRVRAYGRIAQDRLDGLRGGIEVDGVQYGPIEAVLERQQGDNVWITFAIREGKNREIRNVMRALGLQVNRLIRVSYGPFQLAELPEGAVEEVRTRVLREQLGERLAAQSGADFDGPVIVRKPAPAAPPSRPDKERPRHEAAGARSSGARPASRKPSGAEADLAKTRPPRRDGGPLHRKRRPDRGRRGGPRPSRPKER